MLLLIEFHIFFSFLQDRKYVFQLYLFSIFLPK